MFYVKLLAGLVSTLYIQAKPESFVEGFHTGFLQALYPLSGFSM